MTGNSCLLGAFLSDGKTRSELYDDLMDSLAEKELVPYIYSKYVLTQIGQKMDEAGYKRNLQHQHKAKDVIEFMGLDKIQGEQSVETTYEAAKYGLTKDGKTVHFSSAEDALDKAFKFNSDHKWRIARVIKNEGKYDVIIENMTSENQHFVGDVEYQRDLLKRYQAELHKMGLDLSDFNFLSGFDLSRPSDTVQNITRIKRLNTKAVNMTAEELAIAMTLGKNNTKLQNLLKSNSLNEINLNSADRLFVLLHNPATSETVKNQITSTIDNIVDNFEIQDLVKIPNETHFNYATSERGKVDKYLHDFNEQIRMSSTAFVTLAGEIKTIKDALQAALFTTNRELNELRVKKAPREKINEMSSRLQVLAHSIQKQRYVLGLSSFLQTAAEETSQFLKSVPSIETIDTMSDAVNAFRVYHKALKMIDSYGRIMEKLISLDSLAIDVDISKEQKKNIEELAQKINKTLSEVKSTYDNAIDHCAVVAYTDLLEGQFVRTLNKTKEHPEGIIAITELMKMHKKDTTAVDRLYSMGRLTDPRLAGVGKIILKATENRNRNVNEIKRRTSAAYYMLRKEGKTQNTSFMFTPIKNKEGKILEYRIISDRNWQKFEDDLKKQQFRLIRKGVKGLDFYNAMEKWKDEHMEDMAVDVRNGEIIRTERVPRALDDKGNVMYLLEGDENPLNGLNEHQRRYYDTMMQIKGEIGTMLPEFAQNQFIPPQIRKDFRDAMREVSDGQTSLGKAISYLWQRIHKEDKDISDKDFKKNGIIVDGSVPYKNVGDFDGTPLNSIPIFYINRLEHPEEILKEFTYSLEQFAYAACEYSAMDEIQSTVEVLASYLHNKPTKAVDKEGNQMASIAVFNSQAYVEQLRYSYKNTTAFDDILDQLIAIHMYHDTTTLTKKQNKWVKFLMGYTSTKGLAVNVKGATANWLVGEAQLLIESGAKEYFDVYSYLKGHAQLFGAHLNVPGEIQDLFNQGKTTRASLLIELFDPSQDYARESIKKRYKTWAGKLLSGTSIMGVYSLGEKIIHLTTMYAILNYEHALLNGKEVSLIDCFEVVNKKDGNAELKIKEGATRLTGEAIDDVYLQSIKDNIRSCNQKCHGSMNTEDKGVVTRMGFWKLGMQFRQWAVEHASRRWRKGHIDVMSGNVLDRNLFNMKCEIDGKKSTLRQAFTIQKFSDGHTELVLKDAVTVNGKRVTNENLEEWRKELDQDHKWQVGYYRDTFDFLSDLVKALRQGDGLAGKYYAAKDVRKNMNQRQRYNAQRTQSELALIFTLAGIAFALGDDENKFDDDWMARFWFWQLKKLQQDMNAFAPWGIFNEGKAWISNPIPMLSTVSGMLYPILGLADINQTLKTGPDKGKNKYLRNIHKYTIPFEWQIRQLIRLAEDDAQFNIFDTDFGVTGLRAKQ